MSVAWTPHLKPQIQNIELKSLELEELEPDQHLLVFNWNLQPYKNV